jgi:hypothetical protein
MCLLFADLNGTTRLSGTLRVVPSVTVEGKGVHVLGAESEAVSRQVIRTLPSGTLGVTNQQAYSLAVAGGAEGAAARYEKTASGEWEGPIFGGHALNALTAWPVANGRKWSAQVACTRDGPPDRNEPEHTVQHKGVSILVRYLE